MRPTVLLCLFLGACASAPTPEPYFARSVGSGYSASVSEVPRRFETGVATKFETIEAGLIVRPDAMLMSVEIEEEQATAGQALTRAQATANGLAGRLQQLVAAGATFTPCGTKVTATGSSSKLARTTEAFRVVVSGRIEVPLAPALDYWKRSALVAALAELTDKYEAARVARTANEGVSLSALRIVVKDPEGYRGKLTDLWLQRARAFATAAQEHEAPLVLVDCAPPGDIVQKEKSLEEIVLSLSESCRLSPLKAASSQASAR